MFQTLQTWVPALLDACDDPVVGPHPGQYSWEDVLAGRPADLADLWLRLDDEFRAGGLHDPRGFPLWERVLAHHPERSRLLRWLRDGVNLDDLWVPFRGRFQSKTVFDSPRPPPRAFPNHPSTQLNDVDKWIDKEIATGLRSGAFAPWDSSWGTPALIHPLGIEPEKPRLIFDWRYGNLWLPNQPFTLPRVESAALWVSDRVASCDDKSGFYHVLFHPNSYRYTAFRWRGKVYFYRALPFGLKLSPWIYQLFSEAMVLFLRRQGLLCHVYIDDALISAVLGRALADAVFAFVDLRTRLGFTISRKKSFLKGGSVLVHLGIILDCLRREWRVPADKIARFKKRVRAILADPIPLVSAVQRVAGQIAFFAVAIPSAMLFARSLFSFVAAADRVGAVRRALRSDAREDLERWLTLDDEWNGISWRSQAHTVLDMTSLHTDASLVSWAGVIVAAPDGVPRETMGDTFLPRDAHRHIHVKEAIALRNALTILAPAIGKGWIRALCDNTGVVAAFNHDGSRDPLLNDPLKDIFDLQVRFGFSLTVEWVSTKANAADAPTRSNWWHECSLADWAFSRAEGACALAGPFTVDLMASAWNTRCARFYSRFRSTDAAGMDVFAQNLAIAPDGTREHGWCYPPFVMIPAILAHIRAHSATVTIVVPERMEAWWPVLWATAAWKTVLVEAGEPAALCYPPGMHKVPRASKERLWAFLLMG